MKYLLSTLVVCLALAACAKKQIIVPTSNAGVAVAVIPVKVQPKKQEVQEKKESSIRNTKTETVTTFQTTYFNFDDSALLEEALPALKANAAYMKANEDSKFCVEGYCDDRGTIEYNLALGQRRAYAVREYYRMLGVPAGQMATISYGKERPAVEGTGEEVWAQNRRVETKLLLQAENAR